MKNEMAELDKANNMQHKSGEMDTVSQPVTSLARSSDEVLVTETVCFVQPIQECLCSTSVAFSAVEVR